MKLSVFTVATPELTPEELAKAAAGIDGIEWRYKEVLAQLANEQFSFGDNICSIDPSASDQELERFRLAAAEHHLVNLSVTPYMTCGDVAMSRVRSGSCRSPRKWAEIHSCSSSRV